MSEPVQPVSPTPSSSQQNSNVKHLIIVGILVLVSTFLLNYLLQASGLLPVEASAEATIIDKLFDTHFAIIAFLFSLITVFLVYSLVVFRRKPGQPEEGMYFKGSSTLEVVWTLIPLISVIILAYLGAQSLTQTLRVDTQALVVKVTGFQWAWAFEYPDYGVTSQSLYLPVNKQVLLKMTSRDVIHSFWVPEFRVKQDVLPGENFVKELRFTPTRIGDYQVLCSEICGGAHAYMNAPVIVMTEEKFNEWITKEASAVIQDPAQRGAKWSANNGCLGCHTIDGKESVGPTWKALFEADIEQIDGSKVKATSTYLRNAILKPRQQMRKGYSNLIMPDTYGTLLTPEQIDDIIAYIQSLK